MTALYCPQCGKVHEFRRPQAYQKPGMYATWADAFEVIAGVVIFTVLLFGLPFLLFLWAQP